MSDAAPPQSATSGPDGLIFAQLLDGKGGASELDWAGVRAWRPADGVLWVHLDRTAEPAQRWVHEESGIDAAVAETLVQAQGNRPRVQRIGDALLVILRGVNMNRGEEQDDMPSMHMWVGPQRIVSLRRRRLMAGAQIRGDLEAGLGPVGPGDFLVHMASRLIEPMAEHVAELYDTIDDLQEKVVVAESSALRRPLQEARQAVIGFRRHIAPQRDAVVRLVSEHIPWLRDIDRAYLREIADHTVRYVEDLDAAREQALVAQDMLSNQLAERMNKTMYVLTVFSALLLPPALVTGLLGINVGGMPGVDSGLAFTIVALVLPVLAALEFWLLRRLRWI